MSLISHSPDHCLYGATADLVLFRSVSRDYSEWSRDDWLRLINSASDQPPDDVTDRYSL